MKLFFRPRLLTPLLALGLSVWSGTAHAGWEDKTPTSTATTESMDSRDGTPPSPQSESMEEELPPYPEEVIVVLPPPQMQSMDPGESDSSRIPDEIELIPLPLPPPPPERQRVSPRSLSAGWMTPILSADIVSLDPGRVIWETKSARVPKPIPEMTWKEHCLADYDVCRDYCRREGKQELRYFLNQGVDSMRRGCCPTCCIGQALGCCRFPESVRNL